MTGVELIDVTKRCGEQTVLQPLDLTIPGGSFTVLVGPPDYDKSTLLHLLAGFETLSGSIILMDKRPVDGLDPADHDVAMVFQNYALYPHLTVAENLAFHMQVKEVNKQLQRSKVQQVTSLLGIDKLLVCYPRALSGGQHQRAAMSRAMVGSPQVFLFDEPLSNLDAQLRVEPHAEIKSLHRRINATMIYVTHGQVGAIALADQIVMMHDEQVVQQGTSLTIYDQPYNTFAIRFISSPPMNLLPGQRAVRGDQPGVACGTLWFPLAERWHQAVAQQGDAPLIVGLHPQGIPLDIHDAPATVNIMEVTGESTLLHLDWQGSPVHVRVAGRVAVAAQQTLGLILRRENLHLFDAASGKRLAETR